MKYSINLSCCLCSASHKAEIEIPNGWDSRYGGIDDENGFCPKHSGVADFASSNCAGCVGGWTDCPMWEAFAYSGRRSITAEDYVALESGTCPRRVNGTFSLTAGKLSEVDLTDDPAIEGGKAFAQAIKDYIERYQ